MAVVQDLSGNRPNNAPITDPTIADPDTAGGDGVRGTTQALTVTTGNTFQQVFAANSSRLSATIQNPADATETLYVNIGDALGSATKARSIQLSPGGSYSAAGNGTVEQGNINVTAAATGHAFLAINA